MATIGFKAEGEAIYLIGRSLGHPIARGHLGQSLWLREIHGRRGRNGRRRSISLSRARSAKFVRELIADGWSPRCTTSPTAGSAVALAEMALAGNLGARACTFRNVPNLGGRSVFGEDQGRYS